MKKLMIILIIAIIALGGGLTIFTKISTANDYYVTTENIKYDTVLEQPGYTITYYYQSDCHYCNSIKDQMSEFTELIDQTEGVNVKLVDMKDDYNKVAWYDWSSHNEKFGEGTPPTVNPDFTNDPALMNDVDDIKITGTPTMILTKDDEVLDFKIGGDVFDILEEVRDLFEIDYQFDRSRYGK